MDKTGLSFKNGTFKIMQIADAQELPPHAAPDTVRLIRMAIEAEKPDLVVFTGDQLYGITPKIWSDRFAGRVLSELLEPVAFADVPFAVTFGNHDEECGVPNRDLAKLFEPYPRYVPGERRSDDDPGTFRVPVYGADGSVKTDVFVFDSHGSVTSGRSDGVEDEQLLWFESVRGAERKDGAEAPPALVFQHIPCPEYYNVVNRVTKGAKDAVEAFGSRKGRFYALPDEIREKGGFMGESPSVAGGAEFGVLKADGGVFAIAAGHDHKNSFVAPYEGIDLIYTQCAGFHVYGPFLKRGVRMFVLNEDDPAAYTTYTRTWEDLTDDKPSENFLQFLIATTPSSLAQGVKWGTRALAAIAAGTAGIVYLSVRAKKK